MIPKLVIILSFALLATGFLTVAVFNYFHGIDNNLQNITNASLQRNTDSNMQTDSDLFSSAKAGI